MRIVLEIKDQYIANSKYILLVIFVLSMLSYAYFFEGANTNIYLLIATVFAIYMAINLGANDVANNMGPAVGSKALTLGGAIAIAVVFEAAGALIAGGDVVNTIKGGIIDPSQFPKDSIDFIAIMLATLLGSAIWVNVATILKAPVSITHSILGGLIGAGITAGGIEIVNWPMMGKVAIALVIAVFMGGVIATLIYISIRKNILKKSNKGQAAKHWVPIYVSLMTLVFALYLILKGFKHKLGPVKEILEIQGFNFTATAIFVSITIALAVYSYFIIHFRHQKKKYFEDSKTFVNTLFNLPLIFAVSLLSFAHGANDVANAIGPLAAINDAVMHMDISGNKASVPFWIMLFGAVSLSLGLAVFGGRLIKTVGNSITKLDQTRAYSIALAAAITVILASSLGLPVSTTQIALGGIFGIGLYRQYLKNSKGKDKQVIEMSKLKGIVLSWIITFPIAGLIASGTYLIVMWLSK